MVPQEQVDRFRRAQQVVLLCLAALFVFASSDPLWGQGNKKRGKCLEWEKQRVSVQKCAHFVKPGGHCSHYTTTTVPRKVCVRWERPGEMDDLRRRLGEARLANALAAGRPWIATPPDWIDDRGDQFRLEVEDGLVRMQGVFPVATGAAEASVDCEFGITSSWAKRLSGTCRNQIPVFECDGQEKLCQVDTEAVLRPSIDWRINAADGEGTPADDYLSLGWSSLRAYVVLEGPSRAEDMACDCQMPDAPTVASVALPIRDVPGDLDCWGAIECYQMGSEADLANDRKLRYWEAGCFAGSTDACTALGTALLPEDPKAAAHALARSCYQGQPEKCEVVGRLFENGLNLNEGKLRALSIRMRLGSAQPWYQRGCDEGQSSACKRQDIVDDLQKRWAQKWTQCGEERREKRRRKCEDELAEWLRTAWSAS